MTAPPQLQAELALVVAYQQQTQGLRDRLAAAVASLWRSLGSYRQPDMATFVRQVVPLVAAGQRQMSATTVGFHSAQRTAILGRSQPVRVDPASVSGSAARNGTDPAEVYGRPFHLVWRDLGTAQESRDAHYDWTVPTPEALTQPPLPPADYVEQAIQAGLDRAVQTALTDLQLAKVQTSQQVLVDDAKVTGYRRVLEGAYSCGLCIVASTLRYHREALLPIHPGCDCAVAAIYGDNDPGVAADDQRLADAHAAIQQRFGKSNAGARLIPGTGAGKEALMYRDVLISHDHGELGSVLAVRGQDWTGPGDLGK